MVQEREEILKLLGLSPTQAHVYLTLIKTGRTSARTLAELTGVACPDIYRIMDVFEKKGLIIEIIELPKKFEATKIEQALPILMNNKIQEAKKLGKDIRLFIKEMKQIQKCDKVSGKDSDLILLPATKIIVHKRKEKILNAQQSIDTIISWKCHKAYLNQNYKAVTKKALDKGVKYRLIIENPKKTNLLLKSEVLSVLVKSGARIKYTSSNPPALVTIYDNKEAIVYTTNKAGLYDTPLMCTNNSSIVSIVTCYFEYLWMTTEMQQSNTNAVQ